MKKTAAGLAAYAKAQLGKPYWWGTFGQIATPQLLEAKRAQYPSNYTANDFSSQMGKRVHDCVGLIKGYLWSETPDSPPQYGLTPDVAVSGLYAACTQKGDIKTIPEIPGVCVFKKDMGHVGVYVGHGMVVEALGHAYGVVTSALGSRPWTFWGMPEWIDYGDEAKQPQEETAKMCSVRLPIVEPGDTGDTVKAMQRLLIGRGYSCGIWGADGDYGSSTKKAVLKFQKEAGLLEDAEIGPKTWAALLGVS